MSWTCLGCGAANERRQRACENCGVERVTPRRKPVTQDACPVDGGALIEGGWCVEGHGYPVARACPFVCARCRVPLLWDGGCVSCHGSETPDTPSTRRFEGDRYELERGHWRKVAEGPRPCSTDAEIAAGLARLKTNLSGVLSRTPTSREPSRGLLADGREPVPAGGNPNE